MVLNAKEYEIPQNRERVFIISIRKDIDKGFEFPKPFNLKLKLVDLLEDEVDKSNYLTNEQAKVVINQGDKFDEFLMIREATKLGYAKAFVGDSVNLEHPNSKTRRGRVGKQVAQTLTTSCNQAILMSDGRLRKLTPLECFRLMGFDDADYQVLVDNGISHNQIYKMAGNSIVVNVLIEIFRELGKTYEEFKFF